MLLLPFERFVYAPDSEGATAVADEETDDIRGETEPSDDDATVDEAPEPAAEAADDSAGDDAVDEEPVAEVPAGPATFEHGIEGLPNTAEGLKGWYAQQQQSQTQLRQEHEQYRNQLLWLSHQMQQHAAQRQQEQQAAQQKQPEAWKNPLGDLPEFRPEWLQLVERDDNGNLVARPGAMPDLPQKIASYQRAREDAIDKMLRDPASVLKSFVEHNGYLTREQAQQQFVQMLDQRDEAAHLEKLRAEATWAFTNGQLNELGQRWDGYYRYLRSMGVPYREASKLADDGINSHAFMAGLNQPAQQAPAPAPAAPVKTAQDKRREVRQATNPPSRSGTLPKSAGRNRLNGSLNLKQALKESYANLSDNAFRV